MNVFLTGATGVLGRPSVRRLVAAGHRVRALARSDHNVSLLRSLGADPVPGSLFDRGALAAAVAGADAVLHLASKIPPSRDMMRAAAWEENDRIRREGTRNLVDAALGAGVGTFVYAGVSFVYPDSGDAWIDAATTPADPVPMLDSNMAAEREVARFAEGGGRGISLRFGFFYGPESPSTGELLALARRGVAVSFGRPGAYHSFIWVDDAAAAVVAAVERAPAGVFDIVDDQPVTRAELAALLARTVGRRWIVRPPALLLRLVRAPAARMLTLSQRVSNRRFRDATGWAPSVPSVLVGLPRAAAALAAPAPARGKEAA